MRLATLLLAVLLPVACGPGEGDAPADHRAGLDGAPAAAPRTPEPDSGGDRRARADPHGPEALRVVFLGTSLTEGYGLPSREASYPFRLEALADSAGVPIEVVEAGVGGDTSAGGLRRLSRLLDDPVDVLVVELGANDGLRGLEVGQLEENLRRTVRTLRERQPDARVVLLGMQAPPNLGEWYTDSFRDVYPRVAAEEGAALVPFLLQGVAGRPGLNQSDRIHPNEEGHRRMAENVWPVLRRVLEEELREMGRPVGEDP